MIGGWNRSDNYLKSMERIDLREGNKCVQLKEMKESRSGAAAAERKGMIYVTGGFNLYRKDLDSVEMFDFFSFNLMI